MNSDLSKGTEKTLFQLEETCPKNAIFADIRFRAGIDMKTTVDIESVLARKYGDRKFPRFVISFLNRLLCLDYFNGYFKEGKSGIEFCTGALEHMGNHLDVEGLENIPSGGRYTFVSNHPIGGVDGVALAGIVGTRFGSIKLPVNDFLMAIPGLRPVCIPINKTGGQSRNLPELIRQAFDSDDQIVMFPAGICSRLIDGKVQDIPWSKTFITQSIRSQRDIVPVHFYGENSRKFYRIAKLGDALKLKFKRSMAFLPEETYKNRGKTFRVVFGKPIPYATFDKSRTPVQWAQWVREKVYEL